MSPLYSLIIAQHPTPPQTPDYRLGALNIEWIDYHSEKEIRDGDGESEEDEKDGKDEKEGLTTMTKGGKTNGNALQRRFTQGTTALGPGIVHLFRHSPPDPHSQGPPGPQGTELQEAESQAEGEDGTLVGILAVPTWMGFEAFGEWLDAWVRGLEGFRMIRDASPNKTLVLLKFEDPSAASDFISVHTAAPFSRDPDRSETCHPIRIHHLLLQDMSRLEEASPKLAGLLVRVPRVYELPTCPVCLERMDSVVTGLITTPCTHRFNCRCLHRWGDNPSPDNTSPTCPVCRFSHRGTDPPHPAKASPPQCMRCTTAAPDDTWICLICGYLGCSRYQLGHARDHYTETGHAYSMEIVTQRVWDYLEDNYVHRLLQNRSDGKLVELPSATTIVSSRLSSLALDPQTKRANGPTASHEKDMTALERMAREAAQLSAQLAEQKEEYEAEVRRLRRELAVADEKAREGERMRDLLAEEEARRREMEERVTELLTAKARAEAKTQIASTLTKKLRQDLASEKAITTGLLAKIRTLESSLGDATERERVAKQTVAEMEETVRDLMVSISMGEKVKEGGGEGGDLGVAQKKKKGRR